MGIGPKRSIVSLEEYQVAWIVSAREVPNSFAMRSMKQRRTNEETAARYEAVKMQLASQYADDRAAYTEGKTAIVTELLAEARRAG